MISKQFVISGEYGFHLRPSQVLMEAATPFTSEIHLIKADGKKANGKSLLELMTLGLESGQTVDVEINGSDEDEVMQVVEKLFKENFGE